MLDAAAARCKSPFLQQYGTVRARDVRARIDSRRTGAARLIQAACELLSARSFDVVLSFDVLYASRHSRAIGAAGNVPVLRPGGFVVINVAALEPERRHSALAGKVAAHEARLSGKLERIGSA